MSLIEASFPPWLFHSPSQEPIYVLLYCNKPEVLHAKYFWEVIPEELPKGPGNNRRPMQHVRCSCKQCPLATKTSVAINSRCSIENRAIWVVAPHLDSQKLHISTKQFQNVHIIRIYPKPKGCSNHDHEFVFGCVAGSMCDFVTQLPRSLQIEPSDENPNTNQASSPGTKKRKLENGSDEVSFTDIMDLIRSCMTFALSVFKTQLAPETVIQHWNINFKPTMDILEKYVHSHSELVLSETYNQSTAITLFDCFAEIWRHYKMHESTLHNTMLQVIECFRELFSLQLDTDTLMYRLNNNVPLSNLVYHQLPSHSYYYEHDYSEPSCADVGEAALLSDDPLSVIQEGFM